VSMSAKQIQMGSVLGDEQALRLVREDHPPLQHRGQNDDTDGA
jgi:hypothetical protein